MKKTEEILNVSVNRKNVTPKGHYQVTRERDITV